MESGNIRSCIGRELIPRPHSVEAAKTIILSDECAQKNRCVCSKIFKGGFPPTTMVISARASRARHNHAQHRRPKRRRPQRLPFSLPNLTTLSVLSPPPARPTASPRRSSQACTAVATSDNPPLCVRRSKLHKFVMLDIATGRQSLFWRSFGSSCCCLQIIPAPWQPSCARCLDSTNIVTAAAFQALALAANEIITNKS